MHQSARHRYKSENKLGSVLPDWHPFRACFLNWQGDIANYALRLAALTTEPAVQPFPTIAWIRWSSCVDCIKDKNFHDTATWIMLIMANHPLSHKLEWSCRCTVQLLSPPLNPNSICREACWVILHHQAASPGPKLPHEYWKFWLLWLHTSPAATDTWRLLLFNFARNTCWGSG